jgi:hypothetical protein
MTFSLPSFADTIRPLFPGFAWPGPLAFLRFPWHGFLIPVFGTAGVIGLGALASLFFRRKPWR